MNNNQYKNIASSLIKLPVLDVMVDKLTAIDPSPLINTVVVYIHHALGTSLNLLDAIFSLGLVPSNTFVLGKHYSENREVVQEIKKLKVHEQSCSTQVGLGRFDENFTNDIQGLWSQVVRHLEINTHIENVLILDHGGYAINFTPDSIYQNFKVVGLEKTSGGLMKLDRQGYLPSFPLINMANCAAKKIIESPLIAMAVLGKLSSVIPIDRKMICGVIGYGAIGKAIVDKLHLLGHKVIICDHDPAQLEMINLHDNFLATTDIVTTIASSELIFGCSGQDITSSTEVFRLATHDKTLISCSSGDSEFLTLLQLIQKTTIRV